ncbi:MAG: hypothetical protein IJ776_01140 [Paludibacteraceae bacterium]|nr:hypothetical protein [Paludibacteraceae bacterium]
MKKSILYIMLLAVAVVFACCNQNTPTYEPGEPATTNEFVYFPVAAELATETDPEAGVTSHDFVIERKDASAELTVNLIITENTGNVFEVPESVTFAAGEKQKTLTAKFGQMEIGSTYKFGVKVDLSQINPYVLDTTELGEPNVPVYEYETTLIKYTPAVGVFVDEIISVYFGYDRYAWYVTYETADLPNGSKKIRILNPYTGVATEEDENGVFDGNWFNEPGDGMEGDYNIKMTVTPEGDVEVEDFDMGIDYGYGPMYTVWYDTDQFGTYVPDTLIDFAAADEILVVGDDDGLYNYVGFTLYLSLEAYQEATYVEPADADIEDYVGTFAMNGIVDAEEGIDSTIVVTITSQEDEDGQYFVISGIDYDVPEVYGYFNERTHYMHIMPTEGEVIDEDGNDYKASLYTYDAEGQVSASKTLTFAPLEDGTLALTENSPVVGFVIAYENTDPRKEDDYFFGLSMEEITFSPVEDAAPAPAVKKRPATHSAALAKHNFKRQKTLKTISLKR